MKDLEAKCFGFTNMDSAEFLRVKKSAFATANGKDMKGVNKYGRRTTCL